MLALVADLCAGYGAGVVWNRAYPTRDGVIPFGLAMALARRLRVAEARAQYRHTLAVQLGAAASWSGDTPAIKTAFRRLERAARGEG